MLGHALTWEWGEDRVYQLARYDLHLAHEHFSCDKSFLNNNHSFADVVRLGSLLKISKRTPSHNLLSTDTEAGSNFPGDADTCNCRQHELSAHARQKVDRGDIQQLFFKPVIDFSSLYTAHEIAALKSFATRHLNPEQKRFLLR